jgi:transcriptional regulator with XRE-family HTH domain
MDPTDPFWRSHDLLAASAQRRYGWIVHTVRMLRGETLKQVAARCSMAAPNLSRLETGRRALRDVELLQLLAEQLEIPCHLLGVAPPPHAAPRRPAARKMSFGPAAADDRSDAVRRRKFLAGLAGLAGAGILPGVAAAGGRQAQLDDLLLAAHMSAAPIPLPQLHARLDQARVAFAACRYGELTAALPHIVAVAHATLEAASGDWQREKASAALARAYLVGSELAVKHGRATIAAMIADRALTHARDGGDVLTVAAGSRQVAIAMRLEALATADPVARADCLNGAIRILTGTAADLGADHGTPPPPVLIAYGSLLCTAGYSAAQLGHAREAIGLLQAAEDAAARVSATAAFTADTVAVYRVSVHNALGDPASALAHARIVNPANLPTTERRMRLYTDTARAWQQHGDIARAATTLGRLAQTAPEELRRPSVKTMITTMIDAPGPTPRELEPLARALG